MTYFPDLHVLDMVAEAVWRITKPDDSEDHLFNEDEETKEACTYQAYRMLKYLQGVDILVLHASMVEEVIDERKWKLRKR